MVEDEPALAATVDAALRDAGMAVDVAPDLARGRRFAAVHPYAVAVLDRRLPDGDGLALCAEWRALGLPLPVLLLTAMDGTQAIVDGFGAGADDYLTKPFAAPELVARVQALARRAPVAPRPVLELAGLRLDRGRRTVHQDGVAVPLTRKEFALLEALALAEGAVVGRAALLETCWDHSEEPGSNVVDVHVRGLRRKLGEGSVTTVRGEGYRMGT